MFVFFLFSDGNITDNVFIGQIHDQKDGEQFKSVFHWDMKSKDGTGAPNRQPLVNEVREEWQMGLENESKTIYYANEMCCYYYYF